MTLCESKVSRRASLAIVPLTVLLLSNVGHAVPSTAITTCPFDITTPGEYYLATDLTCPGSGINIWYGSGVHLKLDGHTLQGVSAGEGISVLNSTDILIQGPGTITGFLDAVLFVNVQFSKVIGVTATRNHSGFVLIQPVTANNLFQGNVATLNDRAGISILLGTENTIVNNLVMNNETGIDLALANLNKIYANTVNSNTLTGISVRGMQNEIVGNTALGNAVEDMFDREPNCDENRWQGNRFGTANQACIQ